MSERIKGSSKLSLITLSVSYLFFIILIYMLVSRLLSGLDYAQKIAPALVLFSILVPLTFVGIIAGKIVQLYADMESASDSYYRFEKTVLSWLGIIGAATNVTDERIQTAMKFIRANSTEKVTCQEVADAVHLSQSRFSHLFRKQVGMTFAAYLIYQRILYVYTQMFQGRSITEAALNAGFSSSAHFADVNRRVFGISASTIAHDLEFTKV